MSRGLAYLLLVAFGALVLFTVVEPVVTEVGKSIEQSAEALKSLKR